MKKNRKRKSAVRPAAFFLICALAMNPARPSVPAVGAEMADDLDIPAEGQEETPEEKDLWEEEGAEPLELETPVLKTASRAGGVIKISWNEAEGAEEYVLTRSTRKDGGFQTICTAEAGTRSYTDRDCAVGKKYYYRLTAFCDEREFSAESKVKAGRALGQAALTGISNVSGSKKLVLSWKPVKGADSYQIERKNNKTGKYEKIGSAKGTENQYTDKDRNGGTCYTYRVRAADAGGGWGSYSEKMSQMAIDKDKKMIALTYDDGPSVYTPVVLKALEKYKVHATFFVVGNRAGVYADSLRKEIGLGCEIGNHTYAHTMLSSLGEKLIAEALEKTTQAVKRETGVEISLMRPPGGACNQTVRRAAGMPIIMWSIDTRDWQTRSTSATIQCVSEKAYDGAIVLMHDIHSPTVKAADEIIRRLKADGYQLVTVSELSAYRGGMKNGEVYSQFRRQKE